MKVNQGLKITDIGIIPDDWQILTLGELGKLKNGINKGKGSFGYGFPFVNLMDVFGVNKITNSNELGLVNSTDTEKKIYKLKKGDILFVRSSVKPEGVGLTTLVSEDLPDTVFSGFLIRFRDKGNLAFEYKEHCFNESGFRRRLISSSTVSANTNINQEALKLLQIILPTSESEQRAIAAALSDVDALITALDRLIAKKRDMKQASMQQLLTGQTRLPGFSGEWGNINMAEDSVLKARIGWQGLTTAEYLANGDYYLVTGTDFKNGRVNWQSCWFVDKSRYSQDRYIQLRIGDILLTKDGTIGKVGFVDYLPGPTTLNSGVFVIRPKNGNYYPLFFYYVLTSQIFDGFLSKLQAGSTINHLYQKDFVNFTFQAPRLEEQIAIATILSEMDAEITVLEQKRDKTRLIKQGMMQELLTGRTRLL